MTNKQILEDYKNGIQHPGFAIFYCKELDKHVIRRLPVKDDEKKIVLSEFEKNGLPPDGYSISVKPTGAVVKRQISKRMEKETVGVRADIPVKNG
jgi:UDP-galactopyranose mutase